MTGHLHTLRVEGPMNEDTRIDDALPVVIYDESSEQFEERIISLIEARMLSLKNGEASF
jgi:hypothetical protein